MKKIIIKNESHNHKLTTDDKPCSTYEAHFSIMFLSCAYTKGNVALFHTLHMKMHSCQHKRISLVSPSPAFFLSFPWQCSYYGTEKRPQYWPSSYHITSRHATPLHNIETSTVRSPLRFLPLKNNSI